MSSKFKRMLSAWCARFHEASASLLEDERRIIDPEQSTEHSVEYILLSEQIDDHHREAERLRSSIKPQTARPERVSS